MIGSGIVSRGNHIATYDVRGGLVIIDAGVLCRKSAELGRLSWEATAGLLLRELIVEGEERERSAGTRSK